MYFSRKGLPVVNSLASSTGDVAYNPSIKPAPLAMSVVFTVSPPSSLTCVWPTFCRALSKASAWKSLSVETMTSTRAALSSPASASNSTVLSSNDLRTTTSLFSALSWAAAPSVRPLP